MVSPSELDKWDASALAKVLAVTAGKHKRLVELGDSLDGIERSLAGWGGQAADAWRAEVGKRRTDITEQQTQVAAVRDALEPVIEDVRRVVEDYKILRSDVAQRGWTIADSGKVSGDVLGSLALETERTRLEDRLKAILERATNVDAEIAAAIRRAVTPTNTPNDPQDKSDPTILAATRDVGSQERPGVTDINDPGVTWDPKIDPAKWKESYQNPQLADSPPGMTLPAGAERDAAWKEYLSNYPKDGTRGVLPNPDAVQDKGLKNLGFAATQLGTSYAWNGGNTKGPGKGDYEYDPVTKQRIQDPNESRAFKYGDPDRIGFDCSGLTEYSAAQVNGGQSIGTYTGNQLTNQSLIKVEEAPQPGDLVYYGSGDAHHVAIYVAPGVVVEAPQSGEPVHLGIRPTDAAGAGEMIRVRRLP